MINHRPAGNILEPTTDHAGALRDARILAVMEEYAAALRDGRRPDREAILSRNADLADSLAEYLTGLDFVCAAAGEIRAVKDEGGRLKDESENGDGVGGAVGVLGDYRLIREVGRGGMGVVYEAEQISLARRVALKVLPFAAVLDDRALKRFKNEALAAAQLDHSHIVDVFGVGSERGIHFYAMRFIEGRTLAEAIEEARRGGGEEARRGRGEETVAAINDPTKKSDSSFILPPSSFRAAASLAANVADALHHAHESGVIHRDVKPSNLMLDSRGKVWITDFGLALIEANASLTATGDLVGTLRYMSPEQALAKRVGIDHRTDVYSLGATLYELVTLAPVFSGTDRQELLRQIAFEEPRPPRRINKRIPAELDTILLKCLEKNPADRYADAAELSADLRRFVEDRPIRAKKPGLWLKTQKWGRRHSSFVAAAAVCLVLGVVAASLSTWLIWRKERATASALLLVKQSEQREREMALTARKAVDDMYTRVVDDWLAQEPRSTDLQLAFLNRALGFYSKFAEEQGDDPQTRQNRNLAMLRMGTLQVRLAQPEQGIESLRTAARMAERLSADYPENLEYRQVFVAALLELSSALDGASRLLDAKQVLTQAAAITKPLRRSGGPHRLIDLDLKVDNNLALLLGRLGEHGEADRLALDVLERRRNHVIECRAAECLSDYGGALHNQAMRLREAGQLSNAIGMFVEAVESQQKALMQNPRHRNFRTYLHHHHFMLATLYRESNDLDASEAAARSAIAVTEDLITDFPGEPVKREILASDYKNLASTLAERGSLDAAIKALNRAIELDERLDVESPASIEYLSDFPSHLRILGELLERRGGEANQAASLVAYRRALEVSIKRTEWGGDATVLTQEVTRSVAYYVFVSRRRGKAADRELVENALSWLRNHPPDHAQANFMLGLVICDMAEYRDPEWALQLAHRQLELQTDWTGWYLLALAQFRAGQPQAALDTLDRWVAMSGAGLSHAEEVLLRSVALWQVGRQTEARSAFSEVAPLMDMDNVWKRITFLRAEAAEMLELETDHGLDQPTIGSEGASCAPHGA